MGEGDSSCAGLVALIYESQKFPSFGACAVKAELLERAKPRRCLTQDEIADAFQVDTGTLGLWVERYLEEGIDGLKRR